jgi:hypothetical protein
MKNKAVIQQVLQSDFKEFMNIETNGICNCDKYCELEGTCRAFVISGFDIKNIDLIKMSEFIWNKLNDTNSLSFKRKEKLTSFFEGYDSRLDLYCLERILCINKLYDCGNWSFSYLNGYYGQEIKELKIHPTIQEDLISQIEKLVILKTFRDKIEFILSLEYGFIIEQLKECNYRIEKVNRESIYFAQKKHYEKVKKNFLYKNRTSDTIMGICLKEQDKYRVIDGYNRLSKTKKKEILVIIAEKI